MPAVRGSWWEMRRLLGDGVGMITSHPHSAREYDNHKQPSGCYYGSGVGYMTHVWDGSGSGRGYLIGDDYGGGTGDASNLDYPGSTS